MTKDEREAELRKQIKDEWSIKHRTKQLLNREPANVLFALIDMWQQQARLYEPDSSQARYIQMKIDITYEMIEARINEQARQAGA